MKLIQDGSDDEDKIAKEVRQNFNFPQYVNVVIITHSVFT
jgi:hypothetical protein